MYFLFSLINVTFFKKIYIGPFLYIELYIIWKQLRQMLLCIHHKYKERKLPNSNKDTLKENQILNAKTL